jgi:hypothetical protein
VDLSAAIPIASTAEFEAWLTAHGGAEREVIVAIHKRSSPRWTVVPRLG